MKISNTSLLIVFEDFYSGHCCFALNCEYRPHESRNNFIYKNRNIPASILKQTLNKHKIVILLIIIEIVGVAFVAFDGVDKRKILKL